MTQYRKPSPYRKAQSYTGAEFTLGVGVPTFAAVHGLPYTVPDARAALSTLAWRRLQAVQTRTRLPFGTPLRRGVTTRLPLEHVTPRSDATRLRWSWPHETYRKSAAYRKSRAYRPDQLRNPARSDVIRAPWGAPDAFDVASRLPWAETSVREEDSIAAAYSAADAFNESRALPWGTHAPHASILSVLWAGLARRGAYIALPWGPIGARQHQVITPWPVEPNPGDPGSDPITVPILPVYFMIPTVTAVRLPERTPVQLLSARLSTDAASWGWTFTGAMPFADFGLVNTATRETPVELEITVNGYVFTVLVESFTDNKAFAVRTVSLQGRSRSAILSADYAPTRSYMQAADRTAAQLADEELAGTGWTMLWDALDWLVPGGTFSYADLAPLEALQRIAASVGARIETDRALHELRAKPRYPVSPWEWGAATPYAVIPANIVASVDGGWQGGTNANGVYVYSENAGFGALVKITGTGGEKQLPQVIERLAVSADPVRERGRHELALASKVKNEQVTIPLFQSPVDPGLIPVGVLLDVNDGTSTWRGQVMGVTINAQRSGPAFSVRQVLQIERHFR